MADVTFLQSKRALQCAVALGGCVPVLAGLSGVVVGPSGIIALQSSSISLDSHFRYLSGLLLGIGLFFWTTIPGIENKRHQFQLLSFIVVIGGCGRLASFLIAGIPDKPMLFGLVMEMIVTPCLAFWQYRVSQHHAVVHL